MEEVTEAEVDAVPDAVTALDMSDSSVSDVSTNGIEIDSVPSPAEPRRGECASMMPYSNDREDVTGSNGDLMVFGNPITEYLDLNQKDESPEKNSTSFTLQSLSR